MIRKALAELAEGRDLGEGAMVEATTAMLQGEATPAQVGAFLMAMRMKGPTAVELTAAARVFRSLSTPIRVSGPVVSIDRDEINIDQETMDRSAGERGGTRTFNVSTAVAFVVAACGVAVAKHGLRTASALCGSGDVLEALGVELDLTASAVEACVTEVGVGFFYEPFFHSALRHVAGPRRECGFRSLFNLAGLLASPASPRRHMLGVHSTGLAGTLVEALRNLGAERALAVHGADGMDEITVCGPTHVTQLDGGEIRRYELTPEQFGMARAEPEAIAGGDAAENAEIVRSILDGEKGPRRDVVCLNAGAALWVAGVVADVAEGIERAASALDKGDARSRLDALVERSTDLARGWHRGA